MSLTTYLTRIIWLCLLPLVLLLAYLGIDSVQRTQREEDLDATQLAANLATAVDQNLSARIGALGMLANSPLADHEATWPALYEEAQGFRRNFGTHVLFADPGRRMLFNTREPFGRSLPLLPHAKGRDSTQIATETGKAVVTDLLLGPVSGQPLVAITVPGLRNGKTEFFAITTFDLRHFQDLLERVALPMEWSLTRRDGQGDIIAHRGPSIPYAATEDASARRFVVKSEVSPWSIAIEIPREIFRARMIKAATELAIAFIVAMLVAVLGSTLAGRRLGRSVASLALPREPGSPTPGIAEIAAVRQVLDDASERRDTAEIALRDSEERFRATFEQAAVGIALVGLDGHWLRVNRKLCDIVGFPETELLATNFQELTHPEDLAASASFIEQILAGKFDAYSLEKRYIRKVGTPVWVNVTVALVRDGDGAPSYFVSVIEDIDRRK
ncbi:MAG TPA: PAS domain S-box protein, partial [Casimicrobiaceae bacterium]